MVGALLQLGANPDTRNDFGSPIIKWAAELGNADVVRLLVDAGSDVDAGASLFGRQCRMGTLRSLDCSLTLEPIST